MPVLLGLSSVGDSAQAASTLLADYTASGEVTGETDVSTMALRDGGYAVLFVGASTYGYCLMPDGASTSGWTQEALPETLSPNQLVGWPKPDDDPVVFAVGPDSGGVDLQSTTRSAAGVWSPWAPVAPGPDVPAAAISDLRTVTCAGVTDLVAVLDDGSMWRVDPSGGAWRSIGPGAARQVVGAVVSGTAGVVTTLPSQSQPASFDLVFYPRPYAAPAQTLATGVTVNALAAAERADGTSSLIFLSDKGYLTGTVGTWLIDGADPAGGLTPIDRHTVLTSLIAADATASTPLTLYGTGVDGGTRMWQPGLSTVDQGLFDIGWPLTSLSIGTGAAGSVELVGVERGTGRIRRCWQASSAGGHEPGAWITDDIELPARRLTPGYAHSSVFTVTDAGGNPLADTAVDLYADDVVGLTVGPTVTVAGPRVPVTTKTDASGRLRVTVPTETLSTRKLKIVMSGSTGGDWFTPNGRTRDRMAVVTAPELAPLVADPGQRDAVAAALNRIGATDYADGKAALRADPSPGAPGWRLTIDSRGVTRLVDLDTAALDAAFALPRASVPVGGFLDFFEDVAEAFVDAVATAVEWTVRTVTDGFEAIMKVVIDGITWVVDTTVAFIEEAIAVAETILRAVKATLEELVGFFGWLLSDAAAAIWRTKTALEKVLTDGLNQLPGLARQAETVASTYFADQVSGVEQLFDNLSRYITGQVQPANALTAAGNPVTDAVDELGSILTWVWDRITSLGGGLSGEFSVPPDIGDKINGFLATLTSDVVDEVKSALDAFWQRLEQLASSVDSLATMLLATLVEAARAVVLAILHLADTVSHQFLGLMADILTAITTGILTKPCGDWITQGLYDAVNPGAPQDLTPIGLVALLLAVPTTVVYRAVNGTEPFPPDAPAGVDAAGPRIWPYLAGVAQIMPWIPIDLYLDLRASDGLSPARLRIENFCLAPLIPALLQLLLQPGGPGSTPSPSTPAERAALVAWGVGWTVPAYALVVPLITSGRFGARAPEFVWGLSALGALALATNIAATKKAADAGTATPLDWIIAIARPLPLVVKPAKDFGPTGRVVAVATDVVGGLAAGCALAIKNEQPGRNLT